jgi:Rieske Fe-S protein
MLFILSNVLLTGNANASRSLNAGGTSAMLLHIPAVLIYNNDGFMALSLVCMHLGCTIEHKDGEYECPCHGSKYDGEGLVTRRPSSAPLKRLRVEVNENIILYMEQI